ncbi:AAA family ATPase [Thalassovita taeanensis]|uniref:AAA ATPase domain-containing protein n=1 Tax=Thalassovita taeanensis TaxID=657014 RepID=A0A1H9CBM3_9RHOB|nr:adenylate/guanylate cyclase domain-containing protein [Thalassovita taeanensis]SEP98088.1 AAA ATPase domain-containing protein [Thalassovita taeanensis]
MSNDKPFELDVWLAGIGMSKYLNVFTQNDIDMEVLGTLTSDDLREMGVASIGHRRRILSAAAEAGAVSDPAANKPAERRDLTVMFCDLVGSTALSVGADPEDYRHYISRYREEIAAAIAPFNGHIAQFVGDGIFVYFGYPRATEHDAENAVSAGLAVVQHVRNMASFPGSQPQVRIAIATGLTVVTIADKQGIIVGDTIIGETPNLAARLQALAKVNTVLLSPSTRRLVGSLFQCTDLGRHTLKGFEKTVRVWQVEGYNTEASRFEALHTVSRSSTYFGRDAEVAALLEIYDRSACGAAQYVLIEGEAGFGKSRLARHVLGARPHREHERPVLQCSPKNISSPYHVIRAFVQRCSGITPKDDNSKILLRLANLLNDHGLFSKINVALIAEFVRCSEADLSVLSGISSQDQRSRLMALLGGLIEGVAKQTDAIIIEDIQWIDPSSSELLKGILPRLADFSIIVFFTMRTNNFPDWLCRDQTTMLQLKPLPDQAIRGLIQNVAGKVRLSEEVIDGIAARCNGIPIYAEELTYSVINNEDRANVGDDALGRIPATLAESLNARIDRLEKGRELALVGAVIGFEFPIDLLIAVSGLPKEKAQEGIKELLETNVLQLGQSAFGEAVSFRHMLLRETGYQLLLRKTRKDLHARVARVIKQDFPRIAEFAPHISAFHLENSGDALNAAVEYHVAGEQAAKRSAYAEAITYFSKAIKVNADCEECDDRDRRELSFRLSLTSAMIAARGFTADSVSQEMERAQALSDKFGERAGLIPALVTKWIVLGASGNSIASHQLALRIHDLAQGGDEVDRLFAHRVLGTSHLFVGNFEAAADELFQFLKKYDRESHEERLSTVGPSNHATMSMVGLAQIHTLYGDPEAAAAWRDKALRAAELGTAHDMCNSTVFSGCFLAALSGQIDKLEEYTEKLRSLSEAHDLLIWRDYTALFSGLVKIGKGDVQQGFAQARQGLDGLKAASTFTSGWFVLYASACVDSGRFEEASEVLSLSISDHEGYRWMSAELKRLNARVAFATGVPPPVVRAELEAALMLAESQAARLFRDRIQADLATLSDVEAREDLPPRRSRQASFVSSADKKFKMN